MSLLLSAYDWLHVLKSCQQLSVIIVNIIDILSSFEIIQWADSFFPNLRDWLLWNELGGALNVESAIHLTLHSFLVGLVLKVVCRNPSPW